MKNLKVRKKLLLSFAIVLILFLFSTIAGLVSLNNVRTELKTYCEHPFPVVKAGNTAATNIESLQKNIFRAISSNDIATTKAALEEMDQNYITITEQLTIIEDLFLGDKELVAKTYSCLQDLTAQREQVLRLIDDGRPNEAADLMEDHYLPVIEEASGYLNEIIVYSGNTSTRLLDTTTKAQVATTYLLIVMCVISFVISIILCIYITRLITRPVKEIETAANTMANGVLDISLTYESQDELGSLTSAMKTMSNNLNEIIRDIGYILRELSKGNFHVHSGYPQLYIGDYEPILNSLRLIRDNLNSTMTQINEAAEQVAGGSEQVSNGSQNLSRGAAEQASSIEELATTLAAISEQVMHNAKSSQKVCQKADSISGELANSSERMQDMLDAMADIKEKSKKISSIISTIEDIAFQTNILALNATIEAARAGESGRGFAVVAGEVRSLADKSSAASKDTAALIKDSLLSVESGIRIAHETADSLFTVVDGVQEVTQNVDRISADSLEQSDSLAQIKQGIEDIAIIVHTNSATAEEGAAASEELSAQAQLLNNLVGQFDLI